MHKAVCVFWIQSWRMCFSLAGEQRGLLEEMPRISPFFMFKSSGRLQL
ncbi:hypothetical protein R3I94_020056 [Phoxinus phoxinus]